MSRLTHIADRTEQRLPIISGYITLHFSSLKVNRGVLPIKQAVFTSFLLAKWSGIFFTMVTFLLLHEKFMYKDGILCHVLKTIIY
jgi:hypothetical protein